MKEMGTKLAKGAAWIAAGRIVFVIFGLMNTIVLARILTPSDFGLIAIVTTIQMIIESITSMPFSMALVQHSSPTRAHFDTAFTLNAVRSVLIGIVIASVSVPMAAVYGDPRLIELFIVVAISSTILGFSNPKIVIMTRELIFWQQFLIQSINKVLSVIVAILVAVIWKTYWALLIGIFVGQFLSLIVAYMIVPYFPRFAVSKWRDLLSFSVWLTFKNIMENLNSRSSRLLIGYILGNSMLGIVNVGQNLARIPTSESIKPLRATLFPAFSRMKDDRQRLARNYSKAQRLLTAIAIPIGIGFALICDEVVPVVLGEQWTAAILVIQFSAVSGAVQVMSNQLQPLAMSLGETKTLFYRGLLEFFIRLPLVISGLLYGGLLGYLIASAFADSISVIIRFILVRKLIGISLVEQVLDNWPTFVSTMGMLCVCVFLELFITNIFPNAVLAETMIVIVGGGVTYLTIRLLIWICRGKIDGPETFVLGLASKAFARYTPLR